MKTLKFNEKMVQAIKEGRKTQTRRVLSFQPPIGFRYVGCASHAKFRRSDASILVAFPYSVYAKVDKEISINITGIRCEQLGDTNFASCLSEGFELGEFLKSNNAHELGEAAKKWFRELWGSIYPEGPKAWRDDLWVWVIDFEVVR